MDEPVEVATGPVSVRKALVVGESTAVTQLDYEIRSDAETPVRIRLVETLPEDLSMSDTGFHPEYGGDRWQASSAEGTLTYEGEVGPGGTVSTRVGIRAGACDDPGILLTKPRIEIIDGPATTPAEPTAEGSDEASPTGNRASASELLIDDRASDEPLDVDRPSDSGPRIGNTAAGDPTAEAATTGSLEATESATPDAPGGEGPEAHRVVSTLVAEIESGAVTEDELAVLRDALDLDHPESVRVRLRYLQSEVSNLAAFADEFGAFLDEEGRPGDVLRDLRDNLGALRSRIDEIDTTLVDAGDERVEIRRRLEAIEADVDQLEDALETVRRRTERVDAWREQLANAFESVADEPDA